MRLAVGGDHAGYPLKGPVIEYLRAAGHEVEDFGTHSLAPVDFPDIAQAVCDAVRGGADRGGSDRGGRSDRGVLVCGTGVGAAIAANKLPGIRAAVCHDTYSAHQAVEHDDVNVLCVGAWIVGIRVAEEILEAYLAARFDAGDPDLRRRVAKLAEIERRAARELGG